MILQILLEPRSSNALAMMAAFIEPVFATVMMMKLCGEDDARSYMFCKENSFLQLIY